MASSRVPARQQTVMRLPEPGDQIEVTIRYRGVEYTVGGKLIEVELSNEVERLPGDETTDGFERPELTGRSKLSLVMLRNA